MPDDFKQGLATLSILLAFAGAVTITSVPAAEPQQTNGIDLTGQKKVSKFGEITFSCKKPATKDDCILTQHYADYVDEKHVSAELFIAWTFNKGVKLPTLTIGIPEWNVNQNVNIILSTEDGQIWPNGRSIDDAMRDWHNGADLPKTIPTGYSIKCDDKGLCWSQPAFTENQWRQLAQSKTLSVLWHLNGSKAHGVAITASLSHLSEGLQALGYTPK